MPNYKMPYVVVGIRAQGETRQIERTWHGAPNDAAIARWLLLGERNPHGRFSLAVRYMPTRKGWVILDLRHAQQLRGKPKAWINIAKGSRVYPSESAAVMTAIYALNRQPAAG